MYSNSEANVISGKMLDSNDILAIIIDATGYNKWGLDETCKLDKKEIKYVTEKFGVSVKEKEIMQYRFYRSTNSRDDINMISVTALPGYNAILMDTDRADIPVDSLLTPTEMQETIQYHFENN